MLKMVRAINDDHLARMDERSSPPIDVTCVTCHHGNSRPVTIQHVMLQDDRGKRSRFGNPRVSRSSGRVLREFHVRLHGVHAHRCCLAAWGSSKGNRGDSCSPEPKSGVFPESANSHTTLGQAQLASNDTTAAKASLEKALELAPNNRFVQRLLSRVSRGEACGRGNRRPAVE